MKELFNKIPNEMPVEKYRLVFSKQTWGVIRANGFYTYTDEEMENACNSENGFICNSNGVDLYLLPIFR